MNIVDMIAIIPFYLELGLALFGIDVASLSDIKGALLVVRVLRVLRVVRILKLGRWVFAVNLEQSVSLEFCFSKNWRYMYVWETVFLIKNHETQFFEHNVNYK